MRPAASLPVVILVLLVAVLLLAAPVLAVNVTFVYNASGTFVYVQEVTPTIVGGAAFNAYYVNGSYVRLAAALVYPGSCGNLTFLVYDFYNNSHVKEVNVTLKEGEQWSIEVPVWSNQTVVVIKDSEGRILAAFLVTSFPAAVELPEPLAALAPLLLVALLIGFAGRYNLRDTGYGLIALGLLAPALQYLGFPTSLTALLFTACVALGAALIAYDAKRR